MASGNPLVLYGTAGCHLCEEAEALLHEAARLSGTPLQFDNVDIADDPLLTDCYGTRIPVIRDRISGKTLGWPFDANSLDLFLKTCDGD